MAEWSIDNKKMPLDSYIIDIPLTVLDTTICQEGMIREGYTWIPSESATQMTVDYRAENFGEKGLSLSKEDVQAILVTDSGEDSSFQIEQLILGWSERKQQEATVRHYLQALFIIDEIDTLEHLCQWLVLSNKTNSASTNYSLQSDDGVLMPFKGLKSENPEQQPIESPVQQEPKRHGQSKAKQNSTEGIAMKPVQASEESEEESKLKSGQLKNKGSEAMASVFNTTSLANELYKLKMEVKDNQQENESKFKKQDEQIVLNRKTILELSEHIQSLEDELKKKKARIFELETTLGIPHKQEDESNEEGEDDSTETQKWAADIIITYRRKVADLEAENIDKDKIIEALKERLDRETMIVYPNSENFQETRADSENVTMDELHWEYTKLKNGDPYILGEGTFGTVYKGECIRTAKHLAIKVIKIRNRKACDAVVKEVNCLRKLKGHNRILSYLGARYGIHPDLKKEGTYLQIFTEFMPGRSLYSYIREVKEKGNTLDRMLVKRYIRQILQGAEYLHCTSDSKSVIIIHRDLKAKNILRDYSGHVKLADFGCADMMSTNEKCAPSRKGTLEWMAPEVLSELSVTTKSDIWSIGCTVVEMLICDTPYGGCGTSTIETRVQSGQLNPLKTPSMYEYRTDVEVQCFLTKCFMLKGEDRCSATQLLEDPFAVV